MRAVKLLTAIFVLSMFVFTSYGQPVKSVKIGNQEWMKENLNVDTFRNGDPIPEAKSTKEWVTAGNTFKPAWCYYENDTANGTKYGKLYNWYAVRDPRGLAPEGWHVPSDGEWKILIVFLGGENVAGGKMKETGTTHWRSRNTGATNKSGFSALPGGYRNYDGSYGCIGKNADFWSSTVSGLLAWGRGMSYNSSTVYSNHVPEHCGFSVRCVRD